MAAKSKNTLGNIPMNGQVVTDIAEVTTITGSSNDNQVPTAKATYDLVEGKVSALWTSKSTGSEEVDITCPWEFANEVKVPTVNNVYVNDNHAASTKWVTSKITSWWENVKTTAVTISGAWDFLSRIRVVAKLPSILLKDTETSITDLSSGDKELNIYGTDKNNKYIGKLGVSTNNRTAEAKMSVYKIDGVTPLEKIAILRDGENAVTTHCPTPPSNSNDQNIATTQWVNSFWTAFKTTAQSITGAWTFPSGMTTGSVKNDMDNTVLRVFGGTATDKGGSAEFYGKDHSTDKGFFRILAHDGTNQKELVGKPSGDLTWGGTIKSAFEGSLTGNVNGTASGNLPLVGGTCTGAVTLSGGGSCRTPTTESNNTSIATTEWVRQLVASYFSNVYILATPGYYANWKTLTAGTWRCTLIGSAGGVFSNYLGYHYTGVSGGSAPCLTCEFTLTTATACTLVISDYDKTGFGYHETTRNGNGAFSEFSCGSVYMRAVGGILPYGDDTTFVAVDSCTATNCTKVPSLCFDGRPRTVGRATNVTPTVNGALPASNLYPFGAGGGWGSGGGSFYNYRTDLMSGSPSGYIRLEKIA